MAALLPSRIFSSRYAQVVGYVLQQAGGRWAAGLLASILGSSLLDLVGIAVILPYLRLVIDPPALQALAARLPTGIGLDGAGLLVAISSLLAVVYIVKSILQAALLRLQSRRLAAFTTRVTEATVSRILQARYGLFLQMPASEIGAAAYASPIHVTLALRAALQLANELLFIALLFLVFLVISPLPTMGVVALLLALGALLYFTIVRNTSRLGKRQGVIEGTRYRLLFFMINAIRDIQIMGLGGLFSEMNRTSACEHEQVAWRYSFNNALPLLVIELAVLIGVVGTVLTVLLANVALTQTLPMVGVVAIATVRAVPAVAKLFVALNSLTFYTDLVLKFEQLAQRLADAEHRREHDALAFTSAIELHGVSFAYGEKRILEGIDLRIEAGRCYGIVGLSGSGKSTLLDVFTGLQEATSGRFTCDGAPFDPFASVSLTRMVGYVPQNITLIDDSIGFNISFERPHDPARLEVALRRSNLADFVDSLPEGIDTAAGENGTRLSGGQRQRIGLARAFYRDPRILVLDEATSALDARTERKIASEIAQLRGTLTLLIVSHRIAAVESCDEIVVMSKGRILDRGSHNELLVRCDLYRELRQLQNVRE